MVITADDVKGVTRMLTCDMCGKIVEDNVKRITISYMFNLPFSKGHWLPENVFDVCEGCGKKVLEVIMQNTADDVKRSE